MSSGSESDEEYVPGAPEQVSEEESADEETELQYEKELDHKNKKRKAIQESKGNKKRRTRNSKVETETQESDDEVKEPEKPLNPEEEKKREDDLWAMFLEGTDTKPKEKTENATTSSQKPALNNNTDSKIKAREEQKTQSNDDALARERRIFEFAGETIVVENNVIKEKIKTTDSPSTVSKLQSPLPRGRASGLSNVLDQLNKKNQLSTLEKSKLDWETYKKDEGIEDEIQSHNKGKEGYLDRKDFLERADVRQYEIERDLRLSRRSNR